MQKGQLFFLGRIVSTKGIKGELKASLDVDNPADYCGLDAVFVEKKKELVPFVVSRISIEQKKATLKLEGIDSIEAAQSLVKCLLFLPLDLLPRLRGKQFYFHEVTGYEVYDKNHGLVGTITEVLDLPQNALFQIDHSGKEILIPATDDIIIKVDRKKKRIDIEAPEGLIDLYLG